VIGLHQLYLLAGAMFGAIAVFSALDGSNPKRFGNAAFWGLMAVSLLAGDLIGDFGNGLLVLGLAALAGFGFLGRSHPPTTDQADREGYSERLGNRLFLPALIIPLVALIGTLLYTYTPLKDSGLLEAKRETFVFLGLGVLVALAVIFVWLRPPATAPLQEGRRLVDAIGWAIVLPQMLAALGALFAAAGVGTVIGEITKSVIPEGSIFLTVAVYGLGMALFTMIMGNAFAAFPVMAAAIGVPLLIHGYGGNPAVIGAIGMLAGFSGTLMTPMAANFNLVPAALLELKDRNGVIKAQIGTALPLLAINILFMWWFAFR
jgi:uncharacterized membrane protein